MQRTSQHVRPPNTRERVQSLNLNQLKLVRTSNFVCRAAQQSSSASVERRRLVSTPECDGHEAQLQLLRRACIECFKPADKIHVSKEEANQPGARFAHVDHDADLMDTLASNDDMEW